MVSRLSQEVEYRIICLFWIFGSALVANAAASEKLFSQEVWLLFVHWTTANRVIKKQSRASFADQAGCTVTTPVHGFVSWWDIHEQSLNYISLRKSRRIDVMRYHPLCRACFGQYQASSAVRAVTGRWRDLYAVYSYIWWIHSNMNTVVANQC